MRALTNGLVGIFGAIALVAVYVGYLIPYLYEHQTVITADEIVIGRVTGYGSSIQYAIDRRTGNEKIRIKSRALLIESSWLMIEYSADCACVEKIHRIGTDGYYIRLQADGLVYYSRDGIAFDNVQIVQPEAVRDKLSVAEAIRGDVRKLYKHLIPQ